MKNSIVFLLLAFLLGGIAGTFICRRYYKKQLFLVNSPNYNPDNMPDSTGVKLDSTNLPIVFINTNGNHVKRDDYITAEMTIIDNKGGGNYGDTIAYPDQTTDFVGLIALKYRGMTSYSSCSKKSYAVRVLDKPLSKGGKKKKSKLLGMRKGKKWALKAMHHDKSMIRDALSFELARPYVEFAPQSRFCEVIIDNIYRGVYSLSEQVTADRIKLKKPGNMDEALTGGYLLQIDKREKNGAYISKHWNVGYRYEYPDSENLSPQQKKYINQLIDDVEISLLSKNMESITRKIDVQSMIDAQLQVEFAYNLDSYDQSTFIFKDVDNKDPRMKFCIWDFDLGYGNWGVTNCIKPNQWVYNARKYWWATAMENTNYEDMLNERWKEYRELTYSNEHINHVIDSLTTLLTVGGGEKRNSEAWKIWNFVGWTGPKRICFEKYMSISYEEEIDYLKEWIEKRLNWMDDELLK